MKPHPLGIDPGTFDADSAITLRSARELMHGRGGRRPALEVVRRWCNPKKGCRPWGKAGPLLVFPVVKLGREYLTMPAWVRAFEAARLEAGWWRPGTEGDRS